MADIRKSKRPALSEGQIRFLREAAELNGGLRGPPPDYQGDCINCTGPELQDLVDRKLVTRRAINPSETDGHRQNPPYLRFTHRYKLRKAGRDLLANLDAPRAQAA